MAIVSYFVVPVNLQTSKPVKSLQAYGSVKAPELVKKVNEEIQNLLKLDTFIWCG